MKKETIELILLGASFVLSVGALYVSCDTNKQTMKFQRENDAYTYWQNYLQLAAQNPLMANGEPYRKDTVATHQDSVKYAWFIAQTLGTIEIVYDFQKDDPYWRKTFNKILSLHRKYFKSDPSFNLEFYSEELQAMIRPYMK